MKEYVTTQISLPVPTELFLRVVDFLRDNGDQRGPVTAIWDAVEYWLMHAGMDSDMLLLAKDGFGYQWKSVFLPDGTQIRMQYKGKYFYAKVEGDKVIYDGEPISPGSLANKIAGSSRNAWRDLWIKRPTDQQWRLADECRSEADYMTESLLAPVGEPGVATLPHDGGSHE